MTTHHPRRLPIVLLTGTPGTGKTLHSILLSQHLSGTATPMQHINIGEIVKEKGFHEGWDEEWQSWIVDEDRLLDWLEEVVNPVDGPSETGFILDHHDPSLFPERWIDLAVVLTCDNGVLHTRLTERKYPENKLTENLTAEIMQTVLAETRESYDAEIIVELSSSGLDESGGNGEVDENVRRLEGWVEQWVRDQAEGEGEGDEQ